MAQTILQHLGINPDPKKFNLQIAGHVQQGIVEGMRCKAGTVASSVSIESGKWWTDEGDLITEDSDLVNYFSIASGRPLTPNLTANSRIDLIVGEYYYVSNPDKEAVYKILCGVAGSGETPSYTNDQYPACIAIMPGGASDYSTFYRYPQEIRHNCFLDNGVEKIEYGSSAT